MEKYKTTYKSYTLLALLIVTLSNLIGCNQELGVDSFESQRPEASKDVSESTSCTGRVSTNGGRLNIRYTADISDNVCAQLDNDAPVIVSMEQSKSGFLKIKSTLCSETKNEFNIEWVYASERFINLNSDCFDNPTSAVIDEEYKPKSGRDPDGQVNTSVPSISDYISKNLDHVRIQRPLLRNGARGLVDLYKLPGTSESSICGSKHIRSQRSAPHLGKDTLCAWTSVAQEWAMENCKLGDSNCRIMLGDATFGHVQPASWPHSTHRRGWCMDIWPMRKQGCGEKEVRWQDECYDRQATRDLVKLLIKHGADVGNQLFFNDPQIAETRRLSNHDDHIHVCFKPTNSKVKNSCANLEVDRKYCPEFN